MIFILTLLHASSEFARRIAFVFTSFPNTQLIPSIPPVIWLMRIRKYLRNSTQTFLTVTVKEWNMEVAKAT